MMSKYGKLPNGATSLQTGDSIFYLPLSLAYVTGHSAVLLVQVVVLNVAINSNNNALITLLVANNFTELKSHVFKKLDEASLLQVVCADIVERFQLVIFLMLVTIQNISKDGYNLNKAWLADWGNMVLVVFVTEYLVDWIKHAFVTKFNKVDPEVYNRYRSVLWEHFCDAWKLRQPHRVTKHIGFVSLPISCVTLRVVTHALPPELYQALWQHMGYLLPACLLWWLSLCLLKTMLYLLLLGHACKKHKLMVGQPASPSSKAEGGEGEEETAAEDPTVYPHVQSLMGVQMFHRAYKPQGNRNEGHNVGHEPPSPAMHSGYVSSPLMQNTPRGERDMRGELAAMSPLPAPMMSQGQTDQTLRRRGGGGGGGRGGGRGPAG